MDVRMKIFELKNSETVLQGLMGKGLPPKTAYTLARNIRKIADVLRDADTARVALVKKYSGDGDTVAEENLEAFIEEYRELMEQETSIDLWLLDPLEDVFGKDMTLSVEEISTIFFLFEEPDQPV